MKTTGEYLTVGTVAKMIGMERKTLYDWINKGIVKVSESRTRLNPQGTPRKMIKRSEMERLLKIAI